MSVALFGFSSVKGVGFVDISHVPLPFVLFVLLLSIFVGVVIGYFPAKRDTKISTINALRYE